MRDTGTGIFRLEGVSAGYGKSLILHEISLTITKGDFVSIIGPNGAGKSTLVKLLTGDIPPRGGVIEFKGKRLAGYSRKKQASEMSVVHQFAENILPFRVYDFVRMGRFPHQKVWELESDLDRRLIVDALEITNVIKLKERTLAELSGGELQLVFIARALVQNREIIILDEPISHLDLRHSIDLMEVLHNLNSEGSTIISVLHDVNISSDYCSRIIGIKEGGVFMDGRPEEVINYQTIEALYDVVSIVRENPISGKPYVYSVPEYVRKKSIP